MKIELNYIKFPLTGQPKRVYKVFNPDRVSIFKALGPDTRKRNILVGHSRLGNVPRDAWKSADVIDGDRLVITPRVALPPGLGPSISLLTSANLSGLTQGLANHAFDVAAFPSLTGSILGIHSLTHYGLDYLFESMLPQGPSFGNGTLKSSPTYGFDGMRNTATTGIPVPAFYGDRPIVGNFINSFIINPIDYNGDGQITVNAGERDVSVAYVLMDLGEGEFAEIAGETADFDFDTDAEVQALGDLIKINGNPVSALSNIKVYGRMGADVQDHIPGFEYVHDLQVVDDQLEYNTPYTYTTVASDVDDVFLQLNFKNGAYVVRADGKVDPIKQNFKIEARPVGGSWTTLYSSYLIWAETRSSVRRTVRLNLPSLLAGPGQYEIRITKLDTDSSPVSGIDPDSGDPTYTSNCWLAQVDEVRYDTFTYPHTALLAVVVEASDQLNGEITSLEVHCKGRKVDGAWTDNPAKIIKDIITNPRFGMARYIDGVAIDATNITAAANFCDALETLALDGSTEKRFRLDIVLDQARPAIDWLRDLALHMTAFIYWIDDVIKIIPDQATTPSLLFNHANIIKDTLAIAFVPASTILNQVEVQYFEPDNNYAQESLFIEDQESIAAGDPIISKSFTLPGCIRRSQAMRTGRFRMNDSKFNLRTISFRTGTQGLIIEPGNVIQVAAVLPAWGIASGRILADASGTSITLDTAVALPSVSPGTYTIEVQFVDGTQESRDITAHIDGLNPAGTALTIASAFSQTATAGATFHISLAGAASGNTDAKPFRVLGIRVTPEFETEITAREYNAETYDFDGDVDAPVNYTALPDPRRVPSPAENVQLSFEPSTDPKIRVDYELAAIDSEAGFIRDVEVYIADTNETARERWKLDGVRRPGPYFTTTPLVPNKTYYVKVIPVSRWGVRGNWAAATTASITIKAPKPLAVRGIEVNQQGNSPIFQTADASFQWVEVDPRGFQKTGFGLGNEPLGFGAESRSPWTRGFYVAIWSSGKLRRSLEVQRPRFRYTLDMNRDDHDGTPSRTLTIEVRTVNIFGQHSASKIFDVANPYPTGPWPYELNLSPGFASLDAARTYYNTTGLYSHNIKGTRIRDASLNVLSISGLWNRSDSPDVARYYIINKANIALDVQGLGSAPLIEAGDIYAVTTNTQFNFPTDTDFDTMDLDFVVIEADSIGLSFPLDLQDTGITVGRFTLESINL